MPLFFLFLWKAPCSSNPLGCSCSFSSPGRSLLLRSLWEAPILSLPLEVPCSSNPLGCYCSLLPWKPPGCHYSFYFPGRPLFLLLTGMPLFVPPPTLNCTFPHPSVDCPWLFPLKCPCSFSSLGRSLLLRSPWEAPVLLFLWKAPVPPTLFMGCTYSFSSPGRSLLLRSP
jgi:hypothetical protein